MKKLITALALAATLPTVYAQTQLQDTQAFKLFQETEKKYTYNCFGAGKDESCAAMVKGYRDAMAAPDASDQLRHDMQSFLLHAIAIRGAKLRESGKLEEALQVLEGGYGEMLQHFDGGKHFHAVIENQKLQQETGMVLLQLGRTEEADNVIRQARGAVDRLWNNRKSLTSKGAQEMLQKGMLAGESFETDLGKLYRDNFKQARGNKQVIPKLTKADLAPRVVDTYRRAEQWLLRKDEAGIAGMMDVDSGIRYAEIKFEIGDALLEQKKNKEATEEFLQAAAAACNLVNKGDAAGAKGRDQINADLSRSTCDRASLGWSLASGEFQKNFDKAFDTWYQAELKRMTAAPDPTLRPLYERMRKR
jgi:hypothetical protein